MKTFFNQLFDYNFFCNKKLIAYCNELDSVPVKSKELFSHVLNAHHIWNARLREEKSAFNVFDIHEPNTWEEIHYENQRATFDITSHTDNFEKRISYESSEGRLFANTIQDVLFHIINHSAHHRGQILMDLRQNGIEPLALDYIFYKR
ncbi:DinB family protein [Cytophaga sp. FL35]|uniref:DinB family protein n=1 Tax=Cytophaga sp. FL35 TaxID=1904456 RepID=UPI001653E685|nr:damage-inducible protein DinB [Cytophaga sp. FL35]